MMTLATPGLGPALELQLRTETVWWPACSTAGISKKQISRAAERPVVETKLDTQRHEDTVRPDMLLHVAARQLAVESGLGRQHHEERRYQMQVCHWIDPVLVDNKNSSERGNIENIGIAVVVGHTEPVGQK
jgi:hypothetical protein